MKIKLLAVLLAFGTCSWLATADDDPKAELAKLKGTWKLTAETDAGEVIVVPKDETFVFSGDRLTNKVGGMVTDEFVVKILGDKNKGMDWTALKDPNKGAVHPAIYKLEGNTLTVCIQFDLNGKRPTDFNCTKENRTVLLVLTKQP